jgi:asparagine synthase (glutamine-hydrolysing)
MVPTYLLCKWAREQMTVALSGDGGDEAFCGYRRYRGVPLAEKFTTPLRWLGQAMPRPWRQALRSAPFGRGLARSLDWLLVVTAGGVPPLPSGSEQNMRHTRSPEVRSLSTGSGAALGGIYDRCLGHQDGIDPASLWTADVRKQLQGAEHGAYAQFVDRFPGAGAISRMTHADYRIYLPCDILVKVDRASMAHGLEVRSPFLDHRLVEWAQALAPQVRMPRGRCKHLLRGIAGPMLPAGHFDHPKRGFAVPLDDWLRGPLRERAGDAVLRGKLAADGLLDAAAVSKLFDLHTRRRARLGERLWTLLCIELWYRSYFETAAPPEGPLTW